MSNPQTLPTRQERASRALKNAMTRASKHNAKGDVIAAQQALTGGMKTARQWLNGTHPQIDRAKPEV